MTEPQTYQAWVKADKDEEEASSKFHKLLSKIAPTGVGGAFSSGDTRLQEEFLSAEAKFTEKRRISDKALRAWMDISTNTQ